MKVQLSLWIIKWHKEKTWNLEVWLHLFSSLVLGIPEW
jgi:hypothetical protein